MKYQRIALCVATLFVVSMLAAGAGARELRFEQTNLVSDLAGRAQKTDHDLVNPWGLVLTPDGLYRVAANGTGQVLSFNDHGSPRGPDVTVPGSSPGNPTGMVWNGDDSAFRVSKGERHGPATLITVSEDGTLAAFNRDVDPNDAIRVAHRNNAVYKGVAIAERNGKPYLYVTNFKRGTIDVYDRHFDRVAREGMFEDDHLPKSYSPFNIALFGKRLYVSYAKQDSAGMDDVAGAGFGFVNVFDTSGKLLDRLISRGKLNAPWGMAVAPDGLGRFSKALLVGNFGDGRINAYDRKDGDFIGTLQNAHGDALKIDGLWGLVFGRGSHSEERTLYFTAGIDDENHGLFGELERASGTGDDLLATNDAGGLDIDAAVEEDASIAAFAIVTDMETPVDARAELTIGPAPASGLQVEAVGGNLVRLANGGTVTFRITGTPTAPVQIDIFDVTGRQVGRLARTELATGSGLLRWDGRDLRGARVAAGTYFVRASSPTQDVKMRLILLH